MMRTTSALCNDASSTIALPCLSRSQALSLYRDNEACALLALNRFLRQFPMAIGDGCDKDDLLSEAHVALWRCCERYDMRRGTRLSTMAFNVIYRHLLSHFRTRVLRQENGHTLRIPSLMSLDTSVSMTTADSLPAQSGGGRWGSDGLTVLLHKERLCEVREVWEGREPSRRAKSPVMAAEVEAVLAIQNVNR